MSRLIFAEATPVESFIGEFPANPEFGISNYGYELRAIAATVFNRVNVIANATTPNARLGFGRQGATIADVVYSRGASGVQYAGFTPNGIAGGIQNRINSALERFSVERMEEAE